MASSHDSIVESRPREQWADNLRVIVIAGVIVLYSAVAYLVAIADCYYPGERTASGVWPMLLTAPALIGALFALGPLFLVAGWFSAWSLAHRGPGGFVRSRLLRLGLPLVVFVVLIDPLTAYLGGQGRKGSRTVPLGTGAMEVGVMWFVAALLVFSVAYAAVVLAQGADQAVMGAGLPTMAPEIKFVLVATVGVGACFMAGYALTRVPGISRVL